MVSATYPPRENLENKMHQSFSEGLHSLKEPQMGKAVCTLNYSNTTVWVGQSNRSKDTWTHTVTPDLIYLITSNYSKTIKFKNINYQMSISSPIKIQDTKNLKELESSKSSVNLVKAFLSVSLKCKQCILIQEKLKFEITTNESLITSLKWRSSLPHPVLCRITHPCPIFNVVYF